MSTERTAYWGTCDGCDASVVVYPHPDRPNDLPDDDDWENGGIFAECYVCDGDIQWGGSDPAHDILRDYPQPEAQS